MDEGDCRLFGLFLALAAAVVEEVVVGERTVVFFVARDKAFVLDALEFGEVVRSVHEIGFISVDLAVSERHFL